MGVREPHRVSDATMDHAQVRHIPDADQVDRFQKNIDAQALQYEATGIVESLFDGSADAKAAFDKASQIESAPVTTGGGGGYRFTPAQIEDQLKQCDDLISGLRQDGMLNAQEIAKTKPPANDQFSQDQAKATRDLGERLFHRINNQVRFVQNWQSQVKAVRQNYLNQEGHTEATWKKLSGGSFNDA